MKLGSVKGKIIWLGSPFGFVYELTKHGFYGEKLACTDRLLQYFDFPLETRYVEFHIYTTPGEGRCKIKQIRDKDSNGTPFPRLTWDLIEVDDRNRDKEALYLGAIDILEKLGDNRRVLYVEMEYEYDD